MAGPNMEQCEQFFKDTDTDNSGFLSLDELSAVLKTKGFTDEQIKSYFRSSDEDGDKKFSLEEYMRVMGMIPPVECKGAAFRAMFNEWNEDGEGNITIGDLRTMFTKDKRGLSESDIERMMELLQKYDSDGDNEISREEFVAYFTNSSIGQ